MISVCEPSPYTGTLDLFDIDGEYVYNMYVCAVVQTFDSCMQNSIRTWAAERRCEVTCAPTQQPGLL